MLSDAVALLMTEPDFGASLVLMVSLLGMLFLAGAPFKHFIILAAGASAERSRRNIVLSDYCLFGMRGMMFMALTISYHKV